jgi:small subunit ribosomal protein S27Ae
MYTVKGTEFSRTHKSCPKCGPGAFLAEHADRRSCGRCGYAESKAAAPKPSAAPAPKPKGAKAPAPPAKP